MAERLEDLLRASTVRVLGGPMPGTGFFVAPGRVLTCVHVIGDAPAAALTVRWERDGREAATFPVTGVMVLAGRGRPIPALDRDYPDIALLEVSGVEDHGCVLLDSRRPSDGDGLVVYGFPEEGGAVQLTPARLTYRGQHGVAPTSFWDLGSDTIKPGMSGSAVLNVRTGGVGGVVVATKHPARADGALAVAWEEVAAELQEVLADNRAFHQGNRRWSEAVRAAAPPVPESLAAGPAVSAAPGHGVDPLALFCARLRLLQRAAGIKQTSLAAAASISGAKMSDILNGKVRQLPSWEVTDAVVSACLAHAEKARRPVPQDLRDRADWRHRYGDVERDLEAPARPRRQAAAGWPLAEVTDPFALEVHLPVQLDALQDGQSLLPAYVPRAHDAELARAVASAAQGSSGIAVLVGGSSTGKTRACWEALGPLRDRPEDWRLWHPIDPTRPEAALRELPSIGPRTVVWLNEAQFYLDVADGLGERIAAGLREVLRDRARAPVLVLATLWPQYWDALTARPATGADPHAQARELLVGRDIAVPSAFTEDQLRQLPAAGDPRLAQAAEAAEDGQVVQFLAGVPELMARYRYAPAAARALIDAAIDARRLGMGIAVPLAFLEQAAPGYLTDTDWDGLGKDWLEQALAYTAAPCNGVRGPLTRIRPRPGDSAAPGTDCRLADYLEQQGRQDRRRHIPPAGFWAAAALFAHPADLPALAHAAEARGLLRDAARFRKHAIAHGDTREATTLVWHSLHPRTADPNPAQWAADHAAIDHPGAVAVLLEALCDVGAGKQADILAARAAAHTTIDDPGATAGLLQVLSEKGPIDQAYLLAARVAAHAAVDNPGDVADLLSALREPGMEQQAAALASRAAAHADIDEHRVGTGVHQLLRTMREMYLGQQAATLAARIAARAAAHAALDNPGDVARLLGALREAGAKKQVAALLARDPAAHAALEDPGSIAWLLGALREAGAKKQVAALLARDLAAHAVVDTPYGVAGLLDALREAGAEQQVTGLAARATAHTAIDNPRAVAVLLRALREAGAEDQVAALGARVAAHAIIDDPHDVADLLDALRDAGLEQEVAALAARVAAHAAVDHPRAVSRLLDVLREAGAEQQAAALAARAAPHANFDHPRDVADLLAALRGAGAEDQVAAILARDPAAHAAVDSWYEVADLLDALREAGAEQQVTVLAARATAHTTIDNPRAVAGLLRALREAGAEDQVAALLARDPAAHAAVDSPYEVADLLDALREAGAEQQVRTLVDRLPAEGMFDLFRRQPEHKTQYTFGREPDGSPAPAWGWDDLDPDQPGKNLMKFWRRPRR